MAKQFFVYIATNLNNTVLYTGITNNIIRRQFEHRDEKIEGFTKKYRVQKIVFIEQFSTALEAITAEKKIKGWTRAKKVSLIARQNPNFHDLLQELILR